MYYTDIGIKTETNLINNRGTAGLNTKYTHHDNETINQKKKNVKIILSQ